MTPLSPQFSDLVTTDMCEPLMKTLRPRREKGGQNAEYLRLPF